MPRVFKLCNIKSNYYSVDRRLSSGYILTSYNEMNNMISKKIKRIQYNGNNERSHRMYYNRKQKSFNDDCRVT